MALLDWASQRERRGRRGVDRCIIAPIHGTTPPYTFCSPSRWGGAGVRSQAGIIAFPNLDVDPLPSFLCPACLRVELHQLKVLASSGGGQGGDRGTIAGEDPWYHR